MIRGREPSGSCLRSRRGESTWAPHAASNGNKKSIRLPLETLRGSFVPFPSVRRSRNALSIPRLLPYRLRALRVPGAIRRGSHLTRRNS